MRRAKAWVVSRVKRTRWGARALVRLRQSRQRRTLDAIGVRLGIDQSSARHGYLDHYQKLFDGMTREEIGRIGIIAHRDGVKYAQCLATYLPQIPITLFSLLPQSKRPGSLPGNVEFVHSGTLDEAIWQVRARMDIRVLIEDGTNKKSEKLRTLRELFFHLPEGGLYCCEDLHAAGVKALIDIPGEDVLEYVQRLESFRRMPRSAVKSSRFDRELAASMGQVTNYGRLLTIEKTRDHLLKAAETHRSLSVLEENSRGWMQDEILAEPGVFSSRATVVTNRPDLTEVRFPKEFEFPALHLREYQEVTYVPGQVLIKDRLLLPDSFRHFTKRTVGNTRIQSFARYYARCKKVQDSPTPERLEGTFYHWDSEYPHEYGHALTEMVAWLHGWRRAKSEHPGIKLLLSTRSGETEWDSVKPWVRQIIQAYGITPAEVKVQNSPVVVDELLGVTSQFANFGFAHPGILEVWAELREELRQGSTLKAPDKVFITRGTDWTNRPCRNVEEVEAMFAGLGHQIVHPAELSFADQVELFASAGEIAGFGGSGMLNTIFSSGPKRVTLISPETYDANNEYLISALFGDEVIYTYCDAEIPHPGRGWSKKAYRSPFSFDMGADRDFLMDALTSR